jgi:hypothetical protein
MDFLNHLTVNSFLIAIFSQNNDKDRRGMTDRRVSAGIR